MSVYDELKWRGLVYDATGEAEAALAEEKVTVYIGFDPTAASLHVGSLLPMMALARMQRAGHTPIAIVGGGTGMIGDPSGKSKERVLLDEARIEENLAGIRQQLARFLDFDAADNPAQIVNNADWLNTISMVAFLRDVGKYFTVNSMMAKESVRRRLEGEDGISFTEFSYMLMQAYDFLVLHDRYGCTFQMGGSDQWGNIVAGIDLIRRLRAEKAHGIVMPLVTNAAGTKFGKTEAGTIWLDPELTSPYRFYQFWLNTDDRDVVGYLKAFTWLDQAALADLEQALADEPHRRAAQRTLAQEVTRMVHGEDALLRAEQASRVLFGGDVADLSVRDIRDIFEAAPSSEVAAPRFEAEGVSLVDLLAELGITASKGEARRLMKGGGVRVNNVQIKDPDHRLITADAIEGEVLVLRKGKKNYHLVVLG